MSNKIQLRILGVIAIVAMIATLAMAQSTTTGAIGGAVTDQTGAMVAGAVVSVRNVDTGATASATADGAGRYRVINLQPGKYEVEASSANMKATKKAGIVVEIGLVSNADIVMGVSAASETAEVTGEAPVVNTQQQDFSSNVNQTQINELPINGRRWSQFALMTPGANADGNFGLVSFRGISGLLNNNTVDGGDNNNAFYGEERGRTRISYVISQGAIQEFQVNTSNFSAEYGRAAGAVVNAVTKSGSNAFHGSLFWYYRNEELNAFNPFTTRPTLVGTTVTSVPIKPEDRRHQFGGTVGGPIIKDKLFFFYSFDAQKRSFPGVAAPSSPSFFGPFSASELTTFAGRGITPAEQQAGLDYLLSLTGDVDRRGDQYLHLPKIDWNITKNHALALSYNRMRWASPGGIQTAPVVSRARTNWGNDGVKTDAFNARLGSTITPAIVNEARFQYGRDFLFGSPQTPAPNEPLTPLGLPVGAFIGGGGMNIGTADYTPRPKNPEETRYQYADTLSWALNKHLVKFGIDVNHIVDSVDSLFNAFGTYSYNNRVDFISDFTNISRPALNSRRYTSFTQGTGVSGVDFSTTDWSFFVQDDWRVVPRLTLNLGLRWEYQAMPEPQIPNPLVPGTETLPDDRNNWGPRVGFAWDVFGDSKTALRGGFGIYYGRFLNSTISSALLNTGVVGQSQQQFSFTSSSVGAPLYPNLPAPGTPAPSDVAVYAPDTQAPQIYQADLVLERQLSKNTVLSVSYLFSRGTNLPTFIDRNLPTTTVPITYTVSGGDFSGRTFVVNAYTGARPNLNAARITSIEHIVDSDYHAGVIQFNRRLTKGLQFQTNYTFSRADDTGQGSQTFTTGSAVYDPNDLGLEYGRSNFHARHKFVANAVWQPDWFSHSTNPFVKYLLSGYSIAPFITISSGRTFTGTVSGNAAVVVTSPTAAACSPGLTGLNCAGGTFRLPFVARNAYTFPTFFNTDLRLSKRIPVREGMSVELLAEAFNLTNHVNIQSMNTRQYTVSNTVAGGVVTARRLVADPLFNTPSGSAGTLSRERQLQFAIRFQF
jgi:hypothetical protein